MANLKSSLIVWSLEKLVDLTVLFDLQYTSQQTHGLDSYFISWPLDSKQITNFAANVLEASRLPSMKFGMESSSLT